MKEKQTIYAHMLLETCLKVDKQPLLIIAPIEAYEFVRIITDEALKLGVNDIGYYFTDKYLQHSLLQNITFNKLKNNPLFNKEIYNEYAKKNGAILCLASETPNLMEDIDSKLMAKVNLYASDTCSLYREYQTNNQIAWLIAMVPTKDWARQVFPNVPDPLTKLWETIFTLCDINSQNPLKNLEKLLEKNKKICTKLNNLKIKELHYTNSLGTDLTIGLSKDSIWNTTVSKIKNGKEIVCNYPSFEVFTTPDKFQTNGIVYSSMPLLANGIVIDNFSLEFQNGKVTNIKATKNKATLQEIVESVKNANYLGEVALVPYDSPIRNTETLFYTTLLDENASCHLALGTGFTECFANTDKMTSKEREAIGFNDCKSHTDFMIGTKDLQITATTYDNQEVIIFQEGNFTKEFTK